MIFEKKKKLGQVAIDQWEKNSTLKIKTISILQANWMESVFWIVAQMLRQLSDLSPFLSRIDFPTHGEMIFSCHNSN